LRVLRYVVSKLLFSKLRISTSLNDLKAPCSIVRNLLSAKFKFFNCLNLVNKSMNLENISRDTFSAQRKLKQLYLQNNNIGSIHEDAFKNLTSLKELHLQGNNLVSLPLTVFRHIPTLQILGISAKIDGSWLSVIEALSQYM
jgi:Leucine-rich repeat (LRR) protein